MPQLASFLNLRNHMPLLDVRSPSEFARGHIPGAVSFPLFNDEERAEVGTLYTQTGRQAAVVRGLALVGPKLSGMAERGLELAGERRELALTCWRGGMRSASVAWLLQQAGITTHCLPGGYKAYRTYIQSLFALPWRLLVLGGMTGSGKTEILHALASQSQVIDLEGLAKHRGSAFGALPQEPQPTTEHFENRMGDALLPLDPAHPIWVEDECQNLGMINIPQAFYARMQAAPLIRLHTPRPDRLKRVLYGYDPARNNFAAEGMDRIRKRLGDENHRKAKAALAAGEYETAAGILLDYYDRAYEKQLRKRPAPMGEVRAQPGEHVGLVAEKLAAFEC